MSVFTTIGKSFNEGQAHKFGDVKTFWGQCTKLRTDLHIGNCPLVF